MTLVVNKDQLWDNNGDRIPIGDDGEELPSLEIGLKVAFNFC